MSEGGPRGALLEQYNELVERLQVLPERMAGGEESIAALEASIAALSSTVLALERDVTTHISALPGEVLQYMVYETGVLGPKDVVSFALTSKEMYGAVLGEWGGKAAWVYGTGIGRWEGFCFARGRGCGMQLSWPWRRGMGIWKKRRRRR